MYCHEALATKGNWNGPVAMPQLMPAVPSMAPTPGAQGQSSVWCQCPEILEPLGTCLYGNVSA